MTHSLGSAAEAVLTEVAVVEYIRKLMHSEKPVVAEYIIYIEKILALDAAEIVLNLGNDKFPDEDESALNVLNNLKILIPMFVEFREAGPAHRIAGLAELAVFHVLHGHGEKVPYIMIHELVKIARMYAQQHVDELRSQALNAITKLRMSEDAEAISDVANASHRMCVLTLLKNPPNTDREQLLYKRHTILSALMSSDMNVWESAFNPEILKKYDL